MEGRLNLFIVSTHTLFSPIWKRSLWDGPSRRCRGTWTAPQAHSDAPHTGRGPLQPTPLVKCCPPSGRPRSSASGFVAPAAALPTGSAGTHVVTQTSTSSHVLPCTAVHLLTGGKQGPEKGHGEVPSCSELGSHLECHQESVTWRHPTWSTQPGAPRPEHPARTTLLGAPHLEHLAWSTPPGAPHLETPLP